eukprot:1026721-Rhodomonas_salina.2
MNFSNRGTTCRTRSESQRCVRALDCAHISSAKILSAKTLRAHREFRKQVFCGNMWQPSWRGRTYFSRGLRELTRESNPINPACEEPAIDPSPQAQYTRAEGRGGDGN